MGRGRAALCLAMDQHPAFRKDLARRDGEA